MTQANHPANDPSTEIVESPITREPDYGDEEGGAIVSTSIEATTRGELAIMAQVARQFPRRITAAKAEILSLATHSKSVAAQCMYSFSRGGKQIIGPSVRYAEIVRSAWKHLRVATRVADQGERFITCQAMAHDIQNNTVEVSEVVLKITTNTGQRFSDDMIMVTAMRGLATARRNAILAIVPRAYWIDGFNACRKVVAGDARSSSEFRAEWMDFLNKQGVSNERIIAKLGVNSMDEITSAMVEALAAMWGDLADGGDIDAIFPVTQANKSAAPDATGHPDRAPQNRGDRAAQRLQPVQAQARPRPAQPAQPAQPPPQPAPQPAPQAPASGAERPG